VLESHTGRHTTPHEWPSPVACVCNWPLSCYGVQSRYINSCFVRSSFCPELFIHSKSLQTMTRTTLEHQLHHNTDMSDLKLGHYSSFMEDDEATGDSALQFQQITGNYTFARNKLPCMDVYIKLCIDQMVNE
jgi:hypothetical protein